MKSTERIIVGWLLILASFTLASAQQAPVTVPAASIAIINVNVVPMDRERVDTRQTVLVRGSHIVAVGAARDVLVPAHATVIDAAGRYLVPGLTDAHVHLVGDGTGFGTARPEMLAILASDQ